MKEIIISSNSITIHQKRAVHDVAIASLNISLLHQKVVLADSKSEPKQLKVTWWAYHILLMTLPVRKYSVLLGVETIAYPTWSNHQQFLSKSPVIDIISISLCISTKIGKEIQYSSGYFQRMWLIRSKKKMIHSSY